MRPWIGQILDPDVDIFIRSGLVMQTIKRPICDQIRSYVIYVECELLCLSKYRHL